MLVAGDSCQFVCVFLFKKVLLCVTSSAAHPFSMRGKISLIAMAARKGGGRKFSQYCEMDEACSPLPMLLSLKKRQHWWWGSPFQMYASLMECISPMEHLCSQVNINTGLQRLLHDCKSTLLLGDNWF